MDPMAAIRETFFQECEEQLGELETGLMRMEDGEAGAETVNAVFRAVHSIKGGAGAFSLGDLVRFAHVFETALDQVRAGSLVASPATIGILLRAADLLADLVRAARAGGAADEARVQGLEAELQALTGGAAADDDLVDFAFLPVPIAAEAGTDEAAPGEDVPADDVRVWAIRLKPHPALYAKANETALLLRELGRLGTLDVAVDADVLPDLATLDPEGAYLTWTATLRTTVDEAAIREVFDFVEGDCELDIVRRDAPFETLEPSPPMGAIPSDDDILAMIRKARNETEALAAPPRAAPPQAQNPEPFAPKPDGKFDGAKADAVKAEATRPETAGATIRVDLDRVDRLIDLVGELVINEAMLSQRVFEAGLARASGVAGALDELEQLTREIQDSVMAIRAQPVRSVFQRMPRLVREVAAMTGKQVRLLTDGEATEVDKTVIERIADPLTHMIRNAIDHGLEAPAARVAAGKAAEGVVRLTALHRSGRIVIEVEDDGAGIDREQVKAKAVEKGLVAAEVILSDEETDNLIFLPGFSTASEISDISGRGVGMDVVRRSVQALGGRISIASRPGRGSTFTLSLPLTLAVLDGMVVGVAGHTLIVPLSAIIETLQPRAANIHQLGTDARVIAMRGGYIPLVDIGAALGYRMPLQQPDRSVALLVEGEGGARAVLIVDAIHGQRQVVIKSLEANYRAVPGIAAATVMGDGRVALILDVDTVVSVIRAEPTRPEPQFSIAS
ncbi:MAG: chemotaxis protein CheA [Acidiphilium sp.]